MPDRVVSVPRLHTSKRLDQITCADKATAEFVRLPPGEQCPSGRPRTLRGPARVIGRSTEPPSFPYGCEVPVQPARCAQLLLYPRSALSGGRVCEYIPDALFWLRRLWRFQCGRRVHRTLPPI